MDATKAERWASSKVEMKAVLMDATMAEHWAPSKAEMKAGH